MPEFARNLAVVIGINSYRNGISSLQTAVNDAQKLVQVLREQHDYQVWTYLDEIASLSNLKQLLETTLPEQVLADDRLLFYFAGHGVALNGDDGPAGYLIPHDAKLGDMQSYLPMTHVHEYLSQLSCRHFLGIFDCCFAGAFRWSSTRDLSAVPEVIHQERYDRFITDPAWQVITSAAYDQKALDAFHLNSERGVIGDHSPFAMALLEALAGDADIYPLPGGDGVITATELYLYLRDRIEPATQASRLRQTPGIHPLKKHDKGEYIFLTPGHILNLPPAPALDESQNPYRGLQSFEEEHSGLFFGRQVLTANLFQHVLRHPLTVVLGASGTGKSSLVKAGLIPYVKAENISQSWQILAPLRPGESPLMALNQKSFPHTSLSTNLQVAAQVIFDKIANLCQQYSHLLIVIDQVEELITLCRQDEEREAFLQLLARLIQTYPQQIRIVLTLRSDFEPQFQPSALESDWNAARFIIPAMTREELRTCIEAPASQRVMYFEPHSLVEKLIDEVVQMPGALPLLSFTLSELYLKYLRAFRAGVRDNRAITQADYEALGGVTRSLTQRADCEYDELIKQDKAYIQTIKNVMLRMVAVGGGELARRRVPLTELEYPEPENTRVKAVIQRFTEARLLVEGQDFQGNPDVEPAHDALVQGWHKLLVWKQEEEENISLQRRLTAAAQEWQAKSNSHGKIEFLLDNLDGGFNKIEGIFNNINVGLARLFRRNINQQARHQDKQVQFLWNANPYLDVLNAQLVAGGSWLNQLETEFVERSVRQKRKNSAWRSRIALGVILGLSGLTIWALIGQRQALESELLAHAQAAETLMQSNQPILDALGESLQAGNLLNHWLLRLVPLNEKQQTQVIRTLRKAVYTVREANHLSLAQGKVYNVFWQEGKLLLATVENNGTVRIWRRNVLNASVKLPQNSVSKVVFSPDNNRVAISRNDGKITLWNWQQQQPQTDLKAHQAAVTDVVFSPDGNRLASVSEDGIARVWDTSGNKLQEFNLPQLNIIGIGFNPENQLLLLAISKDNRVLSLWGKSSQSLQKLTPPAPIKTATISPDGKRIVITCDVEVNGISSWLWNWQENKLKPLGKDIIVSFSPDGKQLATTGFDDGIIRLRNWRGEPEGKEFRGHHSQISSINFREDGKLLATGSTDGTVSLWKVQPPQLSLSQTLPVQVSSASFHPNGRQLATLGTDGKIRLFDLSGKQLQIFSHQYDPKGKLSFSPNGQQLAIFDNGKVRLLNPSTGQQMHELPGNYTNVSNLRFSPDSQQLMFVENNNLVRTFNLTNKQHKKPFIWRGSTPLITAIWRREDNQLKQLVAVVEESSTEKSIRMWDLSSSQQIATTFQDYLNDFTNIHFNNDGTLAAVTRHNGSISLWYMEGNKMGELKWDTDKIQSVSFSPTGNMIAVIAEDGTAKLWRLGALNELINMGCNAYIEYLKDNPQINYSHLCN